MYLVENDFSRRGDVAVDFALARTRGILDVKTRQREIMKAPNPKQNSGWDWILLLPRIIVWGMGAFFIGYGIYDYFAHGHYLSALIFDLSVGLVLIVLGIFTSEKTCEAIADGVISGL